jgi:hypothetical protein
MLAIIAVFPLTIALAIAGCHLIEWIERISRQ